ncbi:MAG: oligosaccharide flippase family protein [Gammaproteobacteria bacterium]|nr:oligosaccharide flippase family protein [Gammaproteobacteria bacterium]
MPSLIEKTRRSTLFVVPSQIVIKVVGLLYVILVARFLSVEDYGVYNFFIGTIIVFSFFCNLGLGSSLQRFIPEYSQQKQSGRILKTIIFSHVFRAVLSIITFIVAAIWFDNWSESFNMQDQYDQFIIFAVGAFFLYQIEFAQIELNSLFMHASSSLVQAFYAILKLVLAYTVFELGFELSGLFMAEAASYLAGTLLFSYILVTRVYAKYSKEQNDKEKNIEYKRIGRYSGINALAIPGGILYSHSMDYFVVAALANPYQLGLYALASRAARMLLSILPQNIMQGIIRPAFYHRYYAAKDKNAELERLFQSLIKLNAAFLFPALLLVGIVGEPLIAMLFGDKFIESTNIFLMFLVFNFFVVLEVPSDLVLQAIEKVEVRLYAQIFAVYNIVAAIFLMRHYGVIGVAFATGTALMFKCLFFYYMANRYTGISLCWGALMKIIVNVLVSGVATYMFMALGDSTVYFVGALLIGLLTYGLMTFINNFMDDYEKGLVNKLCKRRLFNV